jgi:integrase
VKSRTEDEKKARGIFERPSGSGVWWINYYEDGKQHREKVGRQGDAIKLYGIRKADILRGRKLPPLRRTAPVMIADLIDLMLEHVRTQKHKDLRTYESRGKIVRQELGARNAIALTPQGLQEWLDKRCRTAATFNRYKALVSLCYKQGIINNKVTSNPARLIPQRKEGPGRLRYLSREEYGKLHKIIQKRFPEHLAEFVVSTYTGMRLSEQYTIDWSQVNTDRRAIDLDKTKNGSVRTVHLNADALAAIESVRRPGQNRTDRVFPRLDRKAPTERKQERFDNRSWFETSVSDAAIPRITWHGLRHTFCSWLAMAGATTREIMEAAGHKTISQAARYSHLSPQYTQSVVDRIAGTRTGQVKRAPKHAPPSKIKDKPNRSTRGFRSTTNLI